MKIWLQGVTLGGTGKQTGDRHPKIGQGALIGASATILGNIVVGVGAMIAAGSLVLKDVPPHRLEIIFPSLLDEGTCANCLSSFQYFDFSILGYRSVFFLFI